MAASSSPPLPALPTRHKLVGGRAGGASTRETDRDVGETHARARSDRRDPRSFRYAPREIGCPARRGHSAGHTDASESEDATGEHGCAGRRTRRPWRRRVAETDRTPHTPSRARLTRRESRSSRSVESVGVCTQTRIATGPHTQRKSMSKNMSKDRGPSACARPRDASCDGARANCTV